MPSAMEKIRRKLAGDADGDPQMVKILAAVLDDGLPAVESACAGAMDQGVHSADVSFATFWRTAAIPGRR
ncbi:hypothetical protein MJC1_04140 [Methylocystis sp. MJC1]|nr:hypothetical protein MJC1_04140 [Methylocystis sp. MJC1]